MSLVKAAVVTAVVAVVWYLALDALAPSYHVHTDGAVLITGASTGIGLHAALTLASSTAFTVFAGVRKETDAKAVAQECVTQHGADACKNLVPIIIDVTKSESISTALQTIENWISSNNKGFAALINNAGILKRGPVEITPLDDFCEG